MMKHRTGWIGIGLLTLLSACGNGDNGNGNTPPTVHPLPSQWATLGKAVSVPLSWSPGQPQVKVAGQTISSAVQGQAVVFTLPAPSKNSDGSQSGGGWGGPQPLEILDGKNQGKGTLNVLGRDHLKTADQNSFMVLSTPQASKDQVTQFVKDAYPGSTLTLIPLGGPGNCGGFLAIGQNSGKDIETTLTELDRRARTMPGVVLAVNPIDGWGVDADYTPMNAAEEVNAPAARSRNLNGKGAVIAVLDTGVGLQSSAEWGSRLLAGKAFTAAGESELTGDDYVGTVRGEDGAAITVNGAKGHGSQVASLAAGNTFGVAPNAEVLPVKVCDSTGQCRTSDVIRGVCWALGYGTTRFPDDMKRLILNLSLGGDTGGFEQDAMRVVLQQAIDLGATVVTSAGNQWADYLRGALWEPRNYPAALDLNGLLAVGAVRKPAAGGLLEPGTYSNRGNYVDLLAPGSLVKAVDAYGQVSESNRGTSFAAPVVAGAVALWRQKLPAASPAELQAALQNSASMTRVALNESDSRLLTKRLLDLSTQP